ncbi:MAG TPA: DUF4260 domain-containing protein [Balneolaceae bacterium]|nr:DUF4260 domain-containing protein [Balneolaceae bacterium]|tara:strand:- start:73376 stop:73720 length:345 start_codon:yes stop_codon:yes gene_type:complete
MKLLLKLEEWALFGFSIYLFTLTDFSWWWYPALIFTPDIGMLGYVINTKAGAFTYNLFHHKGIAVIVLVSGYVLTIPALTLAGIILFGHSCLDRAIGYGLKYNDDFKNTHLGRL